MTTASDSDIVGSFFQSLGEGDAPAAMALLASDVRWTYHAPADLVPWGGTFTGADGVGSFFASFGELAEPIEMAPSSLVEAGGLVYVRGVERSRIKTTGKEYSVEWVHVISVVDGRIATFDEYIDSAAVAATLK